MQLPTSEELRAVFRLKHGEPETTGWSPRMRWERDYFTPDEHYEALLRKLVTEQTRWLDAGCGRNLFPYNQALSRELADRCALLVGVDPDPTLEENPYVHERVPGLIADMPAGREFDLVTLRMVAEHVQDPEQEVRRLAALCAPGGRVVIYTVFKWSPIPVVTGLVPFALHHPVKRVLWSTEAKDTFPVANRMNTRRALDAVFSRHGFREELFDYLDDCRTFGAFKLLHRAELGLWRRLQRVGLNYPEVCLLGVYQR